MLYNAFLRREYIFLLLILVPFLFVNAKSGGNKNSDNILLPRTIRLVHSDKEQQVELNDGQLINLPAIVKETIVEDWAVTLSFLEPLNIGIGYTFEEKQEILKLSEKLGVKIRNSEYLSLYREAVKWLGTRYRWAGNSFNGVDCSGLTTILIKTVFDKDLSRSSYIIADQLSEELDTDNLRPGDLVFFSTRKYKRINHVGVYLGDRQFIHASRKGVVVSSLDEQYYSRTLRKAGRI